MLNSKFFFIFLLLGIGSLCQSNFPTDLNELNALESTINPTTVPSGITKDQLDDPNVLKKLSEEVSQYARAQNIQSKKRKFKNRDHKKRQLLSFHDATVPFSKNAATLSRLVSPVTKFLGVNYDDLPRDHRSAGLGIGTALMGRYNKFRRGKKYQRMSDIMENKFHLNALYINSIDEQNSLTNFTEKMLERINNKVTKTRASVLAKIHAAINPLA